jgi:Cft2 family RNA processing exonuclease
MRIKFLGACREVGRSGVLIEDKAKVLLDYGVKLHEPPEFPVKTSADHIFLSHAHLDHSGSVPELIKNGHKGMVYATDLTFQMSKVLWDDSVKINK